MPTNIQSDPGWEIQTGSDIAPNPAVLELTQRPLWVPAGLLIESTGEPGKYSGAVARSADYPLPANVSNLVLTATFAFDGDSTTATESTELGVKITLPNGITLNGQFQYSWANPETMTLDLTSVTGSGWSPTTFVRPKFAPNVIHTIVAIYKFTDAALSIVSVDTDGELFTTPVNMQNVPGKALGWAKNSFMVNLQLNTNTTGGKWQWMIYPNLTAQFF